MRRIRALLSIIGASVLLSATPLMSAESMRVDENVKDNCLLFAMNCVNSVDSYQQRIERLDKEIAKGTDVYTKDELRVLDQKREDTIQQLNVLISEQGY